MSTRAVLRTRVRGKVDEAVAAFWSDPVINDALQEAYNYYFGFIVELFEGYFATVSLINFDGNAAGAYNLPADFFKTRLVSRILASDKIPLKYFERYDDPISTVSSSGNFDLPSYRMRGAQIIFEPPPIFVEANAVELEYVRSLPILSDVVDVDTQFASLPMAEDALVLRAVVKLKAIEEMVAGGGADSDPFIKDLLNTEQMLKEALEQRIVGRMSVEQYGEDMSENSFRIW